MTTNIIDQHVGARLRSLRQARGLTPEDLSRDLSIPCSRIAALESGRLRISAELMRKLSRALQAAPLNF